MKTKYITYTNKDGISRFRDLSDSKPPPWAVDIQPYIIKDPIKTEVIGLFILSCSYCNASLVNPLTNETLFHIKNKIYNEELICENCNTGNRVPNYLRVEHVEYV